MRSREALSRKKGHGRSEDRRGGKWRKSLERMLVEPRLLLGSGGKWLLECSRLNVMAQKHQLMYSLAVGLRCAESKRPCCAGRLLIA